MPDWRELVRRRLGPLGLDVRREEEITQEFVDHLEESWESKNGPQPAREEDRVRDLDAVDWVLARREIRRAELGEAKMNYRTKTLWLPGILALVLADSLFGFLISLGFQIRFTRMTNPAIMFSLPWILALPVISALGALTSRLLGGRRRESLLAGLSPAATMLALFIFLSPLSLIIDPNVPWAVLLSGFVGAVLAWVIIPGAALLVGALPMALARRHGPAVSNSGA